MIEVAPPSNTIKPEITSLNGNAKPNNDIESKFYSISLSPPSARRGPFIQEILWKNGLDQSPKNQNSFNNQENYQHKIWVLYANGKNWQNAPSISL